MFRLLLAALFTFALVTQAGAQDKKDPDTKEDTKVEVKKEAPVVIDEYVAVDKWWVVAGRRIVEIGPLVLLVLVAVLLIGIRSDMNEIAEKMGVKKD